jgi:hypothetical protein
MAGAYVLLVRRPAFGSLARRGRVRIGGGPGRRRETRRLTLLRSVLPRIFLCLFHPDVSRVCVCVSAQSLTCV